MDNLGKWLIFVGLGIAVLGILVWLITKTGIPLGQLPGDISLKKEGWSLYFPIVSGLIISVILTIVINLLLWIFRR